MPEVWDAVRGVELCVDPDDLDPFATWGYDGGRPHWLYGDPKILVVDDDSDTRQLIASMLERDGLTALEAADGEVAMTLALSECPDLVILDVMMPGLDGYAVCRQLREDLCLHGVPVIMVTGLSGLNDELACMASGADAYLVKPVSRLELMARVRELL
jgi:DNA-binding response OmpR family regulator